ncbi:TPA: TIGR02642 family protein [Photobacterium damselae]
MSRAIELLTRMHDVKSFYGLERGRQTLTGDVLISTFAKVQGKNPNGMDLLMARYLSDIPATNRMIERIIRWSQQRSFQRQDLAIALGCVAFDVYCNKPVASQKRQLTALWRKYSEQAKRSQKVLKRWSHQLKQLQRQYDYSDESSTQQRLGRRMAELEAEMITERRRLDEFAQAQGRRYSHCPRCNGTGVHQCAPCPTCDGRGQFAPTLDNVRQHLRHIGLGRVSNVLWESELQPWFDACLKRMYVEESTMVAELKAALQLEYNEVERLSA